MRKRQRRRPGGLRIRVRLIAVLLVVVAIASLFNMYARPVILQHSVNLVQYTATRGINDAVQDKIYKNRAEYESLVALERDNDSRVTALKTDTISINRIKTEIVNTLYDEINTLESASLNIPIGTLLAPDYFGGMGPKLHIGMSGLGVASADFISAFTQAGINQTRHNIILEVRADVDVMTLFGHRTASIVSRFSVTDTVIVGTVPEQYTYIDDTEQSLLGKVNDYAESSSRTPKTSK
ncbi:MAG: sporulation protein YunB [Intestinibacillus sp.]